MFKEKVLPIGKVFYSDLIPELEHYFTTRESFLKSSESDTEIKHTSNNRKLLANYFHIKEEHLISPTQTHSSNIDIATINKTDYPDTDALILTNKEQAVFLNFADCTPIILYDKKNNIGAIAHAGWRGTVEKIAPKTVKKILELNNETSCKNIYAIIGPAISSCCYNVGQEVINGIKESVNNTNGLFYNRNDKVYIDLKEANKRQLEEFGLPTENIDTCPYCTSCNNDLFFSYRKENGTTNRHNAIIKLI